MRRYLVAAREWSVRLLPASPVESLMPCVFCEIRDGRRASLRVAENDRAFAIMDIHPLSDGHALVIPRTHTETIFTLADADLVALFRLTYLLASGIRRALAPEGLMLLQLNGTAAHQSVPHVHVHLIPRWHQDRLGFDWPLVPGDPERIRRVAEEIRGAL